MELETAQWGENSHINHFSRALSLTRMPSVSGHAAIYQRNMTTVCVHFQTLDTKKKKKKDINFLHLIFHRLTVVCLSVVALSLEKWTYPESLRVFCHNK